MAKAIKFAVVAVCLLCILAICIAPLVDLPATNLRSYQAAAVLLWGLIATAFALAASSWKSLVSIRVTSPILPRRKIEWWIDSPIKLSSILRC
jgi:type VI protein secretion system component VasK